LVGMKNSEENENFLHCFAHRPIRSQVALLSV
jgi:hypothetical protein